MRATAGLVYTDPISGRKTKKPAGHREIIGASGNVVGLTGVCNNSIAV